MALFEYNKKNTNANTKFQLLCTVIMTRKANAATARYPYLLLVINKTTTHVGNGADMTIIST
jgi:hypothetical protein